MTRASANFLLLTAGAVWGMGFLAQSTAMAHIGPWTFVATKFLIAAMALLPFAWREGRRAHARPLDRRSLAGFCLSGTLLFVAAILQQIGIVSTSVTNAGFLTGLYVVFTPLLSLALLRQHPHPVVWPSAAAAFLGIALLGGGGAALGLGDLLMVACALFWALQIMAVGRVVAASGRPLALSAVQFAVCGLLALAGTGLFEAPRLAGLQAALPEILYGGLFATGLAFTLQVIGQRHTSAPQAAIFLSSEALFAALFGALFLGERIGPVGLLGCALIFSAMLAVELVPLRAGRRVG
ncbi:DMT family transporter [Aurantimonas sp. Leaf443]|uniref:DMT family transporter n=1 Tax=Aurantimonas sp. Leaf443 TaxID=1736378 RepID=UPI0006F38FBC|nr:DMT family transporter [Aurantimonas sp. Leaf443]KQT86025.1 MFS transporter [Aurantimonas sp. Leaf443]